LVECHEADDEYFIEEYTCPYPKVAQQDRAICVLHVDMVRSLTAADTRLTASLMRGERACTYRIRPVDAPAAKTS
jgi:predicted ArsR family transcriptional regulator